jgi:hypothetical protein
MVVEDSVTTISSDIPTDATASAPASEPSYSTEKPLSIKKITSVVEAIATGDATGEKTPEMCCEAAGITLQRVYDRLSDLMDAETFAKDRDGDSICLGPDNRTRMAAVMLILELRKHIKDKNVVTQVGIFNDPQIVAEARRVLALRERM